MGGGRKKSKQGALLRLELELEPSESIVRVVSLRGSNIIEVEDADSERTLCLLPAKFNKSLWIKKGGYVVVNGQREKIIESGSKVTGIISRILFEEQIRAMKRTTTWPAAFKDKVGQPAVAWADGGHVTIQRDTIESCESHGNSSDDDELPPIESNQNRRSWVTEMSSSSSSESDAED